MSTSQSEKLITLCNTYTSYLQSNGIEMKAELCDALKDCGLFHHYNALKMYFDEGSDTSIELGLFGGVTCHISKIPPSEVETGDLWLDPFELALMIRTTNPLGFGQGVVGWLSIHPVYFWQYTAFQRLVKYAVRDDSFLQVNDLLTSRPFGIEKSDYATDIYNEEARAYSSWHGKWLASSIRIKAFIQSWEHSSPPLLSDTGVNYWGEMGMDESTRLVYGFNEEKSLIKGQVSEWVRDDTIGLVTSIVDQVGLFDSSQLPRDAGECLTLLNCSNKLES